MKISKKLLGTTALCFFVLLLPYVMLCSSVNDVSMTIEAMLFCISVVGMFAAFKTKFKDLSQKTIGFLDVVVSFLVPFMLALGTTTELSIYYFHNLLIISAVYFLLIALFRGSLIPSIITSVFFTLADLAGEYLFLVKGNVLRFSDIYALKTALTVVGNYGIKFNSFMYCSLLIGAITIFLSLNFHIRPTKAYPFSFLSSLWKNSIKSGILCAVFCFATYADISITNTQRKFDNNFQNTHCGVPYNFLSDAVNSVIKPPEGYSAEKVHNILSRYLVRGNTHNAPNIIVIMNESFADISDFISVPVEKYMPFISSLQDNTTKGRMVSCCYGGGTANMEFEFLTGFTKEFLPEGCYPYLQYIRNNINTIASGLDDGYIKTYIHPYVASNYDRNIVYKYLGFNAFEDGDYFQTGMDYETRKNQYLLSDNTKHDTQKYNSEISIRNYISDKAVYEDIINKYENKGKNEHLMEFVVTMQNHSPYDYIEGGYEEDIIVSDNPQLNQYLYLLSESDKAVKNLIDYFSKVPEDTVILFFGDHKPLLSFLSDNASDKKTDKEIVKDNETLNISDKETALAYLTTPFFIWTNFDSDEQELDYVSTNYLSVLFKDKAGLPFTPFESFLFDCYEEYPVLSDYITIDKNGNYYSSTDEISAPIIKEYEYLQYYFMFDTD